MDDNFTTLPCELEDYPGSITCPHCLAQITTAVDHVVGKMSWVVCTAITLACIPCCCIPFLSNSAKDVRHTCPKCKQAVFVYKIL
ncbi:hypothetical protein; putative LITAF/PIG7 possible membrane associated motif in LPS-induced necrosis factor alpha factor [Ranavirus ambystoma1]|uniref:LITAF domain-containing protein n=2 Tax=Ranavirus ambystoma1 TaxID=265294 RepID=Q6YH96_9VIRU|nr:hypothetical protein ATVp29 [Ambystoma tigrinum virus]AAP33206.1 unknown [Ambystoma tigrinum stebbensi virus]ALN36524.1 putative LITAF/PIG7 possible membrane associated motif in LPS-induced tumor necrosis factor alpha factor [Ambystoma tigrinum virus]ALN36622.1 putative LITAF/PIG7 possible membrane associated motif in LPS-induced tumor necrosis factor alpha factor [Ambystoma tigrinum virus]ALN36725.1 putative LITAF/PIG7 possible membrane associated motif in LPS-induced tumor necrosis factor 